MVYGMLFVKYRYIVFFLENLKLTIPNCCVLFLGAGSNYHPPELFSYQSTQGHMVYGMLFSPHDVQVGKKYPTLLFVYGGPQVQLVTNAYKGLR